VRPILAVPGAGHFVRYWSLLPSAQGAMRGRSKIPVSSFPIKPDHQESASNSTSFHSVWKR